MVSQMITYRIPTLFGYTTLGEASRARELTFEILYHVHAALPVLMLLGTSAFIAVHRQSSKGKWVGNHRSVLTDIVDSRVLNRNPGAAARDLPHALCKRYSPSSYVMGYTIRVQMVPTRYYCETVPCYRCHDNRLRHDTL
jgi:hypothetical protein